MKKTAILAASFMALIPSAAWPCGRSSGTANPSGAPSHHASPQGQTRAWRAQDETHGGDLFTTIDGKYEVVLTEAGVRIYAYDRDGNPLDLDGTEGEVHLVLDGRVRTSAVLGYSVDRENRTGWLEAALALGDLPPGRATVQVSMRNLPSREEPEIEIVRTFRGFTPASGQRLEGHAH